MNFEDFLQIKIKISIKELRPNQDGLLLAKAPLKHGLKWSLDEEKLMHPILQHKGLRWIDVFIVFQE